MNREDIIRMAREAGFDTDRFERSCTPQKCDIDIFDELSRFANAAYAAGAAAEREALSRKYVPMTETQNEVIKWLALGETGSSSKCMAFWLAFGIRQKYSEHHYPADPDDMNRCLKLLQSAHGLRELLPKMAELGGRWAALVSRWDEIESMQMNEIGLDWVKARSAPKTYELMQEVIRSAELEVSND